MYFRVFHYLHCVAYLFMHVQGLLRQWQQEFFPIMESIAPKVPETSSVR